MTFENLTLEKKNYTAVITINHPPANAWNLGTMEEFKTAIDQVETDNDVRVVVITGSGEKSFSAGFDVSDSANAPTIVSIGRALWQRIDRFEKPVIAAINGFALGGGFELALSCHFRFIVDAPKAKLGLTELNLGIMPGWGGTIRLTQIVGKSKSLDMIFFSKKIDAKEAYDCGLVNHISEPGKLLDDTLEFAEKLSKRPPISVSCVLKAISAAEYEGMEKGLQVEEEGTAKVSATKDCVEGFTAFMQKREPVFKGE
ncbi:MAG: enoyl-CoA hydratase [bacterium]|nr:enoyl-CoA hydratase [bacterium]